MDKYIVGMGEALWDCLPDGRKIGGAPANFAYHVKQFGFNSLAISAIGNDELGAEIVEKFNQRNLQHLLEVVDYPTGTVQVTLDDKGIPCYEICEDVAWDNIPYTDKLDEIAHNCKVVCFGSLAQRNSVSRAITSSTRGSLESWNFFLMFSFTSSGFSLKNLMSSIFYTSFILYFYF